MMRSKLNKLLRNGHRSRWWKETVLPQANNKISKIYYNSGDGTYVMEEDWDNLIILDACRYDLFKEVNTIDGRLESRISLGSTSQEYFRRNFKGNEYYDTVYISANPFIKLLDLEDVFYHVENVWDTGWSDSLYTVEPHTMVEVTKEVFDKFPHKRIISHFMQPHHPFIGDFGQTVIPKQTGFNNDRHVAANKEDGIISDTKVVWDMLDEGEIDADIAKKAYKENLELTLPYVRDLIEHIGHKTVVSADHGNLINERVGLFRISGHPGGLHIEELVKVPWLVTEESSRKEIINAKKPLETDEITSDIDERLKLLGYK